MEKEARWVTKKERNALTETIVYAKDFLVTSNAALKVQSVIFGLNARRRCMRLRREKAKALALQKETSSTLIQMRCRTWLQRRAGRVSALRGVMRQKLRLLSSSGDAYTRTRDVHDFPGQSLLTRYTRLLRMAGRTPHLVCRADADVLYAVAKEAHWLLMRDRGALKLQCRYRIRESGLATMMLRQARDRQLTLEKRSASLVQARFRANQARRAMHQMAIDAKRSGMKDTYLSERHATKAREAWLGGEKEARARDMARRKLERIHRAQTLALDEAARMNEVRRRQAETERIHANAAAAKRKFEAHLEYVESSGCLPPSLAHARASPIAASACAHPHAPPPPSLPPSLPLAALALQVRTSGEESMAPVRRRSGDGVLSQPRHGGERVGAPEGLGGGPAGEPTSDGGHVDANGGDPSAVPGVPRDRRVPGVQRVPDQLLLLVLDARALVAGERVPHLRAARALGGEGGDLQPLRVEQRVLQSAGRDRFELRGRPPSELLLRRVLHVPVLVRHPSAVLRLHGRDAGVHRVQGPDRAAALPRVPQRPPLHAVLQKAAPRRRDAGARLLEGRHRRVRRLESRRHVLHGVRAPARGTRVPPVQRRFLHGLLHDYASQRAPRGAHDVAVG